MLYVILQLSSGGGGADSNDFSLYLAGLLAVLADEHVADVRDYCK